MCLFLRKTLSHHPERVDKTCLNCSTRVIGRFCHVCGQENVETKESFWSLTKHFVYDIIHFDGKFFHTLTAIFRRPGFVARRYTEGKRVSYLHPIRMYLFTSAVFFLVFFSTRKPSVEKSNNVVQLTGNERSELVRELQKLALKSPTDTLLQRNLAELLDTTRELSLESFSRISEYTSPGSVYSSAAAIKKYDSAQNGLPRADRDGWMKRRFKILVYKLNPVYNDARGIDEIKEMVLHRLPYMLFVSLPFFALLLKLLYIRRKSFYYSDHAVFTLFHYVLSFILLLLYFGSNALRNLSGWSLFSWFSSLFILAWPVYLFIEMKNFYAQGYIKTFGKFVLLNLLGFLLLGVLFILFSLVSALQV